MFQKIYIKIFLILFLLYQTPLHSKSVSFDNFNSKDLSKYFSGLVASVNKKNSEALNFFNSSKILIGSHDPFIQKYVNSLVLEDKVVQAINVIKQNKNNDFCMFPLPKLSPRWAKSRPSRLQVGSSWPKLAPS